MWNEPSCLYSRPHSIVTILWLLLVSRPTGDRRLSWRVFFSAAPEMQKHLCHVFWLLRGHAHEVFDSWWTCDAVSARSETLLTLESSEMLLLWWQSSLWYLMQSLWYAVQSAQWRDVERRPDEDRRLRENQEASRGGATGRLRRVWHRQDGVTGTVGRLPCLVEWRRQTAHLYSDQLVSHLLMMMMMMMMMYCCWTASSALRVCDMLLLSSQSMCKARGRF